MSHRTCQKFVYTNFASKLRHRNLGSNYQIFYIDLWVTISVNSFTIKRKFFWFFTSRNSLQGCATWSCANRFDFHWLVKVRSNSNFVTNLKVRFLGSFKTWLLWFFKVGVLDCLNFYRALGLFLHLDLPKCFTWALYL